MCCKFLGRSKKLVLIERDTLRNLTDLHVNSKMGKVGENGPLKKPWQWQTDHVSYK